MGAFPGSKGPRYIIIAIAKLLSWKFFYIEDLGLAIVNYSLYTAVYLYPL